ncbi:hypothetical protein pb186bvf_009290 [Paramecium bursaria]
MEKSLMNIYYLIYIITLSKTQIATLSCNTAFTTQADCNSSGYCNWYNGGCQNQECYLVDEVAACRIQDMYVGALVGVCQQINEFSTLQDNKIMSALNQLKREWKFDYKGTATTSSTGYTIQQLKTSTLQNQQIQQLLTLNINLAIKAELNDILDAYLNFIPQLQTVHPHFIEKVIVHSIQKIRDDSTIVTIGTGASNEKQYMMNKVWLISDIWKQRIRNYKPQYIANYYFMLFLQSPLYSKTIGLTSNVQSITITWNSYSENGLISMIFIRLKVFGIKIGNQSGLITVDFAQNDGSILSSPLTVVLKYSWTSNYSPAVTGQVFLFSHDRVTLSKTKLATIVTCSPANQNCQTDPMILTSGTSYQFSDDTADVCTGKPFTYCSLSACTWNGSTCA